MVITDLKHLEQLLKLCRRQGVRAMAIDGMNFALDELPESKPIEAKSTAVSGVQLPDGTVLTDEELMLYSSGNT